MYRVRTISFGLGTLCLLTILSLYLAQPSYGQAPAAIIVTEADTVRTLNAVTSTTLTTTLNAVAKRIVLRFTNTRRIQTLDPVPPILKTALDAIENRTVLHFVNSKRNIHLVAASTVLSDRLEAVRYRIMLRFVNDKRAVVLAFPVGMVPDVHAPDMQNVTSTLTGEDRVTLSWTTNEIARSVLEYGTSVGSYPQFGGQTGLDIVHQVELSSLQPGIYHYRITVTDRSNNTAESIGTFNIEVAPLVPTLASTPVTLPIATATPTTDPSIPEGDKDLIFLPVVVK